MNATREPIAHIDGEPQYAQATMADGSVVVASTPTAIWAEPEPEAGG